MKVRKESSCINVVGKKAGENRQTFSLLIPNKAKPKSNIHPDNQTT